MVEKCPWSSEDINFPSNKHPREYKCPDRILCDGDILQPTVFRGKLVGWHCPTCHTNYPVDYKE